MPTVKQYENQLKYLKKNSKPMISYLTMMAKYCIGQAELIVEVTEKQLRKVDPEFKLPILYLMDSIVKNVKQEYVTYFSNNIVNTFTETFEQVADKTRRELCKLRLTWNQVFAYFKLYSIDFRCHQLDPGWPVLASPFATSKIPVNPFLQKNVPQALTSSRSPATLTTSAATPTIVLTWTSSPSSALPGVSDIRSKLASGADMDPSFKVQLLMKQKQLLELAANKIQLELLAAQKQCELSKIHQQGPAEGGKLQADTETKQKQLLYKAEIAKLRKDHGATFFCNAPPVPTSQKIQYHDPADRKRSQDSQVSIHPVKRLSNEFIETPSMSTGNLSYQDKAQSYCDFRQTAYFSSDRQI